MDGDSHQFVNVFIILDVEQVFGGVISHHFVRVALWIHHFLVREVFQVQDIREVKVAVDLLILEGVKVKYDSLQVHDKHIGRLSNQLPLLNIYFLLAVFASEIINDTTLNHFLEAIEETSSVLDIDSQSKEWFKEIPNVPALGALQLRYKLAAKNTVKQVLLCSRFDELLQPCKEDIQKFLSILLNRSICRIPIKVLESKAESKRVKCLPLW